MAQVLATTQYSSDHSFYVPAFLFKRDAIQGTNNSFDLNIDPRWRARFIGERTEFCGTYHPYMRFWVQVVSKNNFAPGSPAITACPLRSGRVAGT